MWAMRLIAIPVLPRLAPLQPSRWRIGRQFREFALMISDTMQMSDPKQFCSQLPDGAGVISLFR